jgi:hypothetical protein
MELTRECLEAITTAAREAESGTLVITLRTRPEDKRAFDLKLSYEIRLRIGGGDDADAKTARHRR